MKTVIAQTMRDLDARTIRENIFTGFELMLRAGHSVTKEVLAIRKALPADYDGPVAILAGKGNNGGDGFVTADDLFRQNIPVRLFCACKNPELELKGDALTAFRQMPEELRQSCRHSLKSSDLTDCSVIVDAMLGTGFSGALRSPFTDWIHTVNHASLPVISVDLPSGLNADDGSVTDDAVTADRTVTFALPKAGMILGQGPRKCGRIIVADIGIPREFIAESPSAGHEVTSLSDIKSLLRREDFDTYKNRRGHVLVIGGSAAYPSAPFLAAEAALRAGAGLVTVAIPQGMEVFCSVPKSVIVRKVSGTSDGTFSRDSVPELRDLLTGKAALAIGPGMTTHHGIDGFLTEFLQLIHIPSVIDADAINMTALNSKILTLCRNFPSVFTPHEGEMTRLLPLLSGVTSASSREEKALALARMTNGYSVMKGVRSIVASYDGRSAWNLSGCPALSTAGSGDVLTGTIAALLAAAGMENGDLFDAVRTGTFLHGLAGELSSPCGGGRGVTADDIIRYLPEARHKINPVS